MSGRPERKQAKSALWLQPRSARARWAEGPGQWGVSGAFGMFALAVELPFTTTLMLRSIADIARSEGEDLSTVAGRLACMEVFALGGNRTENKMNVGYYTARAFLTRLTGEASAFLLERGVAGASAPVVTGFVAEISSRFGVVVSDRVAASAVPVLGALGGAAES
jgi:hypothetical protein